MGRKKKNKDNRAASVPLFFMAACIAASTLSTLSVSVSAGAGLREGILAANGLNTGLEGRIKMRY